MATTSETSVDTNTAGSEMKQTLRDKETVYKWVSFLSPFVVLLGWEVVVRVGLLDARFFPPPTEILRVLGEMMVTGEIFVHLAISLQRIVLGFIIGSVPGILLGLLIGWFRSVRAFLDPIIAATYPIPKISLLPLLLVIFGIGEASKVVTVAIAGFFLVLISTAHGVMQIDHTLIQAAENYGAKGWKLFSKVILPASLPSIFTGLRLSLGVSLLIIVAAEFVAANKGIGYLIWISWSTLSVSKMYVGLLVISALGVTFTVGLERLGSTLMPWAPDIQHRTQ